VRPLGRDFSEKGTRVDRKGEREKMDEQFMANGSGVAAEGMQEKFGGRKDALQKEENVTTLWRHSLGS